MNRTQPTMDLAWIRCNIYYYFREKCYGNVKKLSYKASKQYGDAAEFLFYGGLANILEGQVQKGISELTPLQSEKDIQLAVVIALIYGYKLSSPTEREALYSLESKLKEEKKQANALSFFYAGLFLSFAEKYEKASEYINKSLRKDANNLEVIILKGWNDMYMNLGDMQVSILDCLELALSKSDRNVEALLGLAKYKYFAKEYDASNLTLDRLIVNNTGQVVPLVEKMKNEFALQKWDAVYDTLERIFLLDPDNVEALKVRIFIALCKNADYIEAADQLNKFFTVLENEESHNAYQFYNTTQIFSRVCSRSSTVLSQVYRFAQYASEMNPGNVDYLSEVGYQCILQGKYKDALSFFKAASKLDSNSITALCGLTLCQMNENGPTEQIELLFEMQGNNKLPVLYHLSAQLNLKNPSSAISFLTNAYEAKVAFANRHPFSLAYVKDLDPDFLLEVYKEFKKHLPKKPFIIVGYLMYSQEVKNSVVAQCMKILNAICDACPGLITALYELAKLKFLFGYATDAQKLAQQVNELDSTHAGSQVLLAQIYIQQLAYTKAAQSLEMCLSYNFKVRDSAMYHFLNGVILKSVGQLQESLSSFLTSLQIATSKSTVANANRAYESDLNIIDKATLYLQIIELQTTLEQFAEAGKTMQEAIQEFSYTSEESRLLIARADLALKKGDVDNAIDLLNEIKPGQPYYFQAHSKMAHIYLKEKNDRAMFTSCFKEIVSNHPMADAHTMMGDAFMSIHDPTQAAEAYEAALKGSPKDVQLVKKLGVALVKMHEYDKACQHYENAIRLLSDEDLQFEYYELLIKLKQYDKVESSISSELNQMYNRDKDINLLKRRVRFLLMQAKGRELKNPTSANVNLILAEAKDLQNTVVKRLEIESRGDIQEEKQQLSNILCALAKAKSLKEPAVAANLYSEALVHSPRDPSTLLALAKLYAQINNSEKCEQTCAILLNTDPNNESAAVMMADLAFRKVDLEAAQRHLTQILSVKPMSWEALAQLIEVQWRRGKLSEAEQALDAAKLALGEQEDHGYWYCAGICSAYAGRANAALRQLNQARRSAQWGASAARRMVLLCLAHHAPHSLSDTFLTTALDSDTRLLALRTAEKLLGEVSPLDRKALQAMLQLATKQKPQAERVLQELLPLATEDNFQDDPYLILAIANAYNIIKQPTRAKNILKRTVSSIPWTPEKADGLERCWLEVADGQISSGRMDAAKELLTKVLNHNNSCATAYQYLGYLAEKEQNYKSSAHNYNNAWSHGGKSDLAVGYKLAHSYLKLKKYPECIVVCRHILKVHPDYPKIKKEILEKAKTNLRT
nr:tetratricopeptide repeat protein 21B [Helicoverpa armigera]XP_049694552.1 tetratricopeptide repeat protein 21B [Helicoverpa armigera]